MQRSGSDPTVPNRPHIEVEKIIMLIPLNPHPGAPAGIKRHLLGMSTYPDVSGNRKLGSPTKSRPAKNQQNKDRCPIHINAIPHREVEAQRKAGSSAFPYT